MKCIEIFNKLYPEAEQELAFCPYRVCFLGAHIDHQHGKVLGMAIDKGVYFACAPTKDGSCELSSVNFERSVSFRTDDIPAQKAGDWADYLRGAVLAFGDAELKIGIKGVFEGELPTGGLSSSAAVTMVFISALAKFNGIHLTENDVIQKALFAERKYVGVSCGKLDQSCEVLSKAGRLLYLDTADDSYSLLNAGKGMKPYDITVFYSGVQRTLVNSKYNLRVDESKSAAYALAAYSGMDYGSFSDTRLRDIPRSAYEEYGERLPDNWRKRAEHFYTEYERAEQGAKAWLDGDLEGFGRLCFESGFSSVHNYESGSAELIKLYEILTKTQGVYGGRFSGAGFKGCCVALTNPEYREQIARSVTDEYLACFGQYADSFSIYHCNSADGIKLN